MTSTTYEFFDTLSLEVRGTEGRAVEQIRQMYHHFEDPSVDDADIVIEVSRTQPDPDVVFGDPDDYYGREGNYFVVQNGSNFMKLEVETGNIRVWPNMEPFYVIYIVEFELRRRLAEEGRALVHASGVTMDGHTTLFPAWRGAGKTNTLLTLLRAGGDFMSDDRLWVGSDGSVQGYPLSVNMQPYNLESFKDLSLDREDDLQHQLSSYIEQNFDVSGSILEKGLVFLNRYYLKDDDRTFVTVDDMVPSAEYVDTDEVDSVVILQAAPKDEDVSIEPITTREAVTETKTISLYEWNARLREYFTALDSLFPSQNWSGELESLIETEQRVFETLYEKKNTYRASIPRERDWNTTGISRQMVDAIRQLDSESEGATVSQQY